VALGGISGVSDPDPDRIRIRIRSESAFDGLPYPHPDIHLDGNFCSFPSKTWFVFYRDPGPDPDLRWFEMLDPDPHSDPHITYAGPEHLASHG
jgi:hypothetical protein